MFGPPGPRDVGQNTGPMGKGRVKPSNFTVQTRRQKRKVKVKKRKRGWF